MWLTYSGLLGSLLGRELLAGRLATGRLTSGLLRTQCGQHICTRISSASDANLGAGHG